MIKKSYMFKGREKELYIILSLPSYYLFASQKKNMISFGWLSKIIHCDTQVTLFSFRGKFTLKYLYIVNIKTIAIMLLQPAILKPNTTTISWYLYKAHT